MAKVAQRFYEVDPWLVAEKGFHPDRAMVSESVFSLANEHMGVRGYHEEGYSGHSLLGSFFNGVYEQIPIDHPATFKGLATTLHFMVNAVDWLWTRIELDGEQLDLARSRFSDYQRMLDMKAGTVTRSFVWHAGRKKRLRLTFVRFVSMAEPHLGGQKILIEPLNFNGRIKLIAGLDFNTLHVEMNQRYWRCVKWDVTGDIPAMVGETQNTGMKIFSSFRLRTDTKAKPAIVGDDHSLGYELILPLNTGRTTTVEKLVANLTERNSKVPVSKTWSAGLKLARRVLKPTFDQALEQHQKTWEGIWSKSDIRVDGDPATQQGLRFSIFNLHQTYHGFDPSLNIGAKGMTGEAYRGVYWWDTETYCLPFYLFSNPKAARNLVLFRHRQLKQAMTRAVEMDCEGSCYPMSTIIGTELCGLWQHGNLEIHVTAAVAYALWHYERVLGDSSLVYTKGIDVLINVCRYFASRGQWCGSTDEFGFYGVMGADEFHMMVHNNAYTNIMAKKSFEYTLDVIRRMQADSPDQLDKAMARWRVNDEEINRWEHLAGRIRTNQNTETGLYEQHDGYFDLPYIDVDAIPPEKFPIYHTWAYDRIFRTSMIKQPDALLLTFFFSHEYARRVKQVNYEYYEPRCSHESSLSPSIHSILACELDKHEEAYRHWLYAARLDLDDYNRNANQGLHVTAMAGAWMNFVYGFGGLRSDGPRLSFSPALPGQWESFDFTLLYQGATLNVAVDPEYVSLRVIEGPDVQVDLYGETITVDKTSRRRPLPPEKHGPPVHTG